METELHEPYTTECLNCNINVWSTYLIQMGMDNDTALCERCFIELANTPPDDRVL